MPAVSPVLEHDAIDPSLDLFAEIERLKTQLNAVLLAHYYQDPDIQDVADHIADSLKLAQVAAETDADVIVFAGVHFMAETAKILNPDKLVLMPDAQAGCSLADSCPPRAFAEFRAQHPDHMVISYINCSAAIKAQSDIIVTSSNAEKIVRQVPEEQPIIFAPDRNLGAYLNRVTGRNMLLWNGSCIVHEMFSEKKIVQLKARHPNALVLAHPECEPVVLEHADHIGSTSSIREFARRTPVKELIIATEPGLIHLMQKDSPDKVFIPAPPTNTCACNECPHMKRNTLEKLYLCMRDRAPAIELDEELRQRALLPIRRMLEMSR
ncbi:MAG TPA: quinolinate synthase NadA [Candidatus Sumerlaeota bacterium]|nr:MAG: Quinolinate synthase A [candidate division BRC1 bacterium ADurb.BinA292]HOE96760.1 quinolinate synthase NadA [Candidatus Sumerlaeota bacterium]